MLEFKKLDIDDKALFESYLKNKYENSETSFANLYIWKDYYNTVYTEYDGFLIILNTSPNGKIHCYMPYGDGDVKNVLDELMAYLKIRGQDIRITSANRQQADYICSLYPETRVRENIAFNDYVYLTESLINLSGKKLHSKRNHLNRFKSKYFYTYREMQKEDFDKCLSLAGRLMLKDRDEDSYSYTEELKSIKRAFKYFDEFDFSGGVIEIDGSLAAFSVGEALTDSCALIHIEKADTQYDGIYAAINNEFAKNRWKDYKYINREEDMGIEGLRKAKLSYRPDHMVRKYFCHLPCR